MASQGDEPDQHHFHNGPLAGEFITRQDLPAHIFEIGVWRHPTGRYVQDQTSAGGRDWDWENP